MSENQRVDSFLENIEGWKYVLNSLPDLVTILDREQRVIWVNNAMADCLEIPPESCTGTKCYKAVHNLDYPPANCPHTKLIKDCKEHTEELYEENLRGYYLITASPIRDASGTLIGCVHLARNITQRKNMEDQVKKSLDEKEMLIKEIHHRVKNNLMIISSLLSIQASYVEDEEIKDILRESQSRARSMALIHEKLYQNTSHKKIDFGDYLNHLSSELFQTYSDHSNKIKLDLEVENHKLDVNTSIPLGLVVNELISNSLKYAFPDNREGTIRIKFYREDDKFVLIAADNGIGLPNDFKSLSNDSMGFMLIKSLTEQIEGELALDTSKGTCFKITFEEPEFP